MSVSQSEPNEFGAIVLTSYMPGSPLPGHLACLRWVRDVNGTQAYTGFPRRLHEAWLWNRANNYVEVHKVPERFELPPVNATRADRDAAGAFKLAEAFVATIRNAAARAWYLWPEGQAYTGHELGPNKKFGATVRYVGGVEGHMMPHDVYRVCSPVRQVVGSRRTVDIFSDPSLPGADPGRAGALYLNVPPASLEIIPDWGRALATAAIGEVKANTDGTERFDTLDPELHGLCVSACHNDFDEFHFLLMCEKIDDRGTVGPYLETLRSSYWNMGENGFLVTPTPNLFTAGAMAIARHLGGTGPVKMSNRAAHYNATGIYERGNEDRIPPPAPFDDE